VNVALRFESLAPTDGICISRAMSEQVRRKIEAALDDLHRAENAMAACLASQASKGRPALSAALRALGARIVELGWLPRG
jgi:ABC-type phosphate/phosphonate transport system substrate-binding protein